MENEFEVLEYFQREIDALAEKEKAAALDEVDVSLKEAMQEYERQSQADADYALQIKMQESNRQQAKQISHLNMQKNQAINQKRKEIEDAVFDEARQRIADYVDGDAYKQKLVAQVQAYPTQTVYVREADLDLFAGQANVKPSQAIALGGFCVMDQQGSTYIDASYDTLLEEQREWFHHHSLLIVE